MGAGLIVLVALAGIGLAVRHSDSGERTAGAPTSTPQGTSPTTVATDDGITSDDFQVALSLGSSGPEVLRLEQRLAELGLDPGKIDGTYDADTVQAVWAFETLWAATPLEAATGTVTDALSAQIDAARAAEPRRAGVPGTHVEVYLPQGALAVFTGDQAVLVAHISSGRLDEQGRPAEYCVDLTVDTAYSGDVLGEPVPHVACGVAKTPGGEFKVERLNKDDRVGPLGPMFNPIYINQGIAIHGAAEVPLLPSTNGTITVTRTIIGKLGSLLEVGDPVYVFDGVKQPEEQSEAERTPIWDHLPSPEPTAAIGSGTTVPSDSQPIVCVPSDGLPPEAGPLNTIPTQIRFDTPDGPVAITGVHIGDLISEVRTPANWYHPNGEIGIFQTRWLPVADSTQVIGYVYGPSQSPDLTGDLLNPDCHPELAIYDESGNLIGAFVDGGMPVIGALPPGSPSAP